jgi:pSer/pThr/pTyr-binding forkhead associated (FHA) protein
MYHEDTVQPLAGWFVVLRSRSMQPYRDIPIFVGRNKIGRDPNLGPHCVPEPNASAEHAMVIAEDGQVEIMDLGSANGTIVNNKPVPRSAVLSDGDMVRIGKTTMVFVPMPQTD